MTEGPKICEEGGHGFFFPLIESEYTWTGSIRAVLYVAALLYLFLGVSIVADKFVQGIEVITSQKKRVLQRSTGRTITVNVWNGTVANLSLMALGSSAPEILLSLVETVGAGFYSGQLGPSTIVGSAAFNLFMIVAVCIAAIPSPQTRRINSIGVYNITAGFSMVAYLWLVVIVQVNTPDVVEVWEAVVTIMFLPIFIFVSYLADIGYITGVSKLPPVERPVGLYVESGASPVAADSHSYQQVWRQQLRRAKSPELADVEGPAASFQHGFFDPGAITDKKGKPLGDPAGILSFPDDTWEVSCGLQGREFSVPVFRKNGSHGLVRCRYRTDGRTAIPGYDFVTSEGELTWEHGETLAQVTVQLLPKELGEHSDQFQIVLEDIEGGAIFNPNHDTKENRSALTVTIRNESDDLVRNSASMQLLRFMDGLINMDRMRLGTRSWYKEIVASVFEVNEDLEEGERPSTMDMLMHLISMPFKLTSALLIPPTTYLGGWATFISAVSLIGFLTCVIIDFAELFGCVTGIEDSITAITIVALGTSMPDLFASKASAQQDEWADASIVNVTGSNAVNVFLGIGLPWSMASIYWAVTGQTEEWRNLYPEFVGAYPNGAFVVPAGDLTFSVGVFTVAACVCLLLLKFRRQKLGGELGGPYGPKVLSSFLLFLLWVFYLALSIWKIVSKTVDIWEQAFAIFIGFCALENTLLVIGAVLYFRSDNFFGTESGDGRDLELQDEALLSVTAGKDGAGPRLAGLGAPKPPQVTMPGKGHDPCQARPHQRPGAGKPVCYGRSRSGVLDMNFTSAAFVCLAAKRLQRGRSAYRMLDSPPPYPPPDTVPPSMSRVPSFYSVDEGAATAGHQQQQRTSLRTRAVDLLSSNAVDWVALSVAGLAAGTLADPSSVLRG